MCKELQGLEEFERAVREELQISSDFDLLLCALSLQLPDGPDVRLTRRLLDEIRVAAPGDTSRKRSSTRRASSSAAFGSTMASSPDETAVTRAAMGLAAYEPADTPETLLDHARTSHG